MTIKIDPNSDCAGELDRLKDLLPKSKHYVAERWTYNRIVSVAVDELYEKVVSEIKMEKHSTI